MILCRNSPEPGRLTSLDTLRQRLLRIVYALVEDNRLFLQGDLPHFISIGEQFLLEGQEGMVDRDARRRLVVSSQWV